MSGTQEKKDVSGAMSGLKLEDSGRKESLSMVQSFLHTRPKHIESKLGTKGRPVRCVTNYIPVSCKTDWLLYQYHVGFSPDIDSKTMRIKLLNEHKERLKMGDFIIFDGAILYLSWEMEKETFESKHPATLDTVEIRVRPTRQLPSNSPDAMTLFNLCLRKALQQLGLKQFGRYFFNPNDASEVPKHKMEIWPGIISAIRVHEEQLLLCCEMAHKMLRTESVYELMRQLYEKDQKRFKENCTQLLVGTTVLARYSNKTYRVDDIVFDMTPMDEFEAADGEKMNFHKYYMKHYNIEIKDDDQPLLMSRVKRRAMPVKGREPPEFIYLIPELCALTGLTEQMRKDRRVMQDLAHFTRVPPHQRVKHVENFAADLNNNNFITQMMARWHLGFGRSAQKVDARILPQEAVMAAKDQELKYDQIVGDWSRDSRSYRATDPKPLTRWLFVYPETDKPKAEEFYNCSRQIGQRIGMQINLPFTVTITDTRPSTYLAAIKYGWEKVKDAEMVVTMVPNDDKNRYDAIKKHCCLEKPVANQVVRSQSLSKNLMSVCGKIILQMNCKLGGSLWRVQIPMRKAMVIGYDSYYDSSERGKSAGAAVFSLNDEMTRWYSQCELHGDVLNMIGNLRLFCHNALLKYFAVNGHLPDRILLYRSGCGEGQIPVVYNTELPDVLHGVKEVGLKLGLEYCPKFAFVIVNKRVNTRYFLEEADGKVTNPHPGTVVDSVVTRPERYDFYLVPQRVTQGTVTPVSYNVIYDSSELNPDHMQRMAFKLCHLYYNWQGTVRIPAPCQYAHKLAFLVSQSLHQPHSDELNDKLFFL